MNVVLWILEAILHGVICGLVCEVIHEHLVHKKGKK